MVLNSNEIRRLIEEGNIKGAEDSNVQPASLDLVNSQIDIKYKDWSIKPGETRLVSTKEVVEMPNNVAGILKTKSSLARLGVMAGDMGGWIDPGFRGNITIAVTNYGDKEIDLSEIKSTTQIVFLRMEDKTEEYNGHYQDSTGTRESTISTNGTLGTESIVNKVLDKWEKSKFNGTNFFEYTKHKF